MLNKNLETLEKELDLTLMAFKKELSKYSLNKVNTTIFEDIKIVYFGETYKLNQISVINIENQIIVIKPFDKNNIIPIYNEIIKLNIDVIVTTQTDDIKITYPQNTSERRSFFTKKIKEISEKYKINIRNIRRNENNKIKNLLKNGNMSKDDEKKYLTNIQTNIDNYIKKIDITLEKKIVEINKL